jgi:epoxyqueuosine reductase
VTRPSTTLSPRAELVHRLADEQGFDLCGIAPAQPSPHGAQVRQWLAAGQHGEMDYLARDVDIRLDPRVLLPGAKAVIVVAQRYPGAGFADQGSEEERGEPITATPEVKPDPRSPHAEPRGDSQARIASYAVGGDYHRRMKKKIHAMCDALRVRFPQERFRGFRGCVDTAPILEREAALAAGLGWIGKNTMLISPLPGVGSYLLLGEIVTTLAIQPTLETEAARVPDHCGTCTRCLDACPTHCIDPAGYTLDASRCVSYLNLEHRSAIDESLHAAMGDWFAGCDVCQDVCPFNRGAEFRDQGSEPSRGLQPRIPPPPRWSLLDILNWDEHARRAAFQGSALKRIKLDMAKRNALIAAGNFVRKHPDHPEAPELRQRIAELADERNPLTASEPALVQQTAAQVRAMLARCAPSRPPSP